MSGESAGKPDEELQFDYAAPEASTPASQDRGAPTVVCVNCGRPVGSEYFTVNGKPFGADCKAALEQALASGSGTVPIVRALVFGLGAGIAGAIIYYLLVVKSNLVIGIFAIGIGYMVGYGVQKGATERGGRVFQIMAFVLTYFSLGLAYLLLSVRGVPEISLRAALFIFKLPVLVAFDSFPSGLITALIFAFGLMQAWRMTAAHQISIAGPFKVGPAAA